MTTPTRTCLPGRSSKLLEISESLLWLNHQWLEDPPRSNGSRRNSSQCSCFTGNCYKKHSCSHQSFLLLFLAQNASLESFGGIGSPQIPGRWQSSFCRRGGHPKADPSAQNLRGWKPQIHRQFSLYQTAPQDCATSAKIPWLVPTNQLLP